MGCGDVENKSSLPIITLDPSGNSVDNVLNVIDKLELSAIETPDSMLFGTLTRGVLYNDMYFLNDGLYDGNIVITNSDGEVIRKINGLGDNIDEYKEITDYHITEGGELEVYDAQKQRFNYYDLEGNYLRKENIGFNFRNYIRKDSILYLFTAKHDNFVDMEGIYNDLIFIEDKKIINKYLPFEPSHFQSVRLHNSKPFAPFKKGLIFSDHLNDTIYYLNNGLSEPSFLFQYVNKALA